jgi:hypothetical protein
LQDYIDEKESKELWIVQPVEMLAHDMKRFHKNEKMVVMCKGN